MPAAKSKEETLRGARTIACAAALLAGLGGCGLAPYRPQPLDAAAAAQRFEQRSLADPALAAFAREHGRTFPPARWDLADLTLAAQFYQPELRVVRARVAAADAALGTARQGLPSGGAARVEHHSDTTGKASAWTYGAELDLPLVGPGRRAAREEAAAAQARAAAFAADGIGWQVRTDVRRRFVELYGARRDAAALAEETAARRELAGLLQKRLELGAADGIEVGEAHRRLVEAEAAEANAATAQGTALAALARAVGVPATELEHVELAFDAIESPPPAADASLLQDRALHARADLRRALADYAAAEAAVKLEVAKQYPEISLRPGYAWDQGDRRWSFAVGWMAPPQANAAGVHEAEARRELAASQFLALQARAIGDVAEAQRRLAGARDALARVEALTEAAREQEGRVARGFAAGAVDRGERVAASLARLAAEQARTRALVAAQLAAADLDAAVQPPPAGDAPPLALGAAERAP